MARIGLIGPSYSSQSPTFDCERTINLYTENAESEGAKSRRALYPTPGLKARYNLGDTSILGLFACRPNGSTVDRLFALVQNGLEQQQLYELFPDYSKTQRWSDSLTASLAGSFAANGSQLAFCVSGAIYVLNLSTNAVSGPAAGLNSSVSMIGYSDGFGIALLQNSNEFQVSGLLDLTSWPGLGAGQVSEFPDNVVSMIVNQRGVWFMGTKATVPYYDQGAINVPFLPVQGVFIEGGCGAQFSVARLDNSIFWLDLDERGMGVARRANGYTPQRISNHAVEETWRQFPQISDAVGYAYQEAGHAFYVLYFPSGISASNTAGKGATWVYDVATGEWHERAYWNSKGYFEAHHSQNHAFAWGKHFVGDWASGEVYEMSLSLPDDNGNAIRRIRRGPTVSSENQWLFVHELVIDAETGLGPEPPLTGPSQAPLQYVLGDAAGNPYTVTCADNGTLSVVAAAAGSVISTPILNDQAVSGASYQLQIVANVVTLVATTYDQWASALLKLGTPTKETQITVQNGALVVATPAAATRGPQLWLRYSKDNGHTWSNYIAMDMGQAGQFLTRCIRRRLGRARSWTPELSYSDSAPLRIIEAYAKISPAMDQPSRRTMQQFTQNA